MAKMRIVLVDDHEVVRLGIKALLEQSSQFEVVGEASNAKEAIEMTGKIRPDHCINGHPSSRSFRY